VLGRLRHDFGQSFLSFLVSGRKVDGGGDNQLFGPDFQWQPRSSDIVSGQYLWSRSETPIRPDLADEWDGRELDGTAAFLLWQHDDGAWDWYLEGQDIDPEFRADNGFVPQVGFQQGLVELGRSWRPSGGGTISRFRLFTFDQYSTDEQDDVLTRIVSGGFELYGARDLRLRLRLTSDEQQVQGLLLKQSQARLRFSLAPSATFARLWVSTYAGDAIDYDNAREGDGAGLAIEAILRSPTHLEVKLNAERNQLDVDVPGVSGERLFTADLARARVTYTFTPRCFLRAVVQWVETERDPELYTFPVDAKESDLQTSLLLAYKWNWQSIVYLGYGDEEIYLPTTARREKASRQIFLKLSWAFRK
ncbi:MAG: hypothetical protein ACREQY_20295, partial [Candidatus Binatia bacterium]